MSVKHELRNSLCLISAAMYVFGITAAVRHNDNVLKDKNKAIYMLACERSMNEGRIQEANRFRIAEMIKDKSWPNYTARQAELSKKDSVLYARINEVTEEYDGKMVNPLKSWAYLFE